MRVKTLDWLLAHGFPPLCFQQSIVCCAFWRYSLTIRSAPRCAVGSVTCNAVSRRCMPSIAICASRNASTLPVMLYCLRASASAISQARSVASAICKLVDIGHQFIPAGIHPGFFGAGTYQRGHRAGNERAQQALKTVPNENSVSLFLFRARCEDPLDLLKMIEVVPREHLHDRFDCLRPPFLMHSTDLPLFGSQRLEQRYVRLAKRTILGEGFSYVALVVVERRQPRVLIKAIDSRARLAHNSANQVAEDHLGIRQVHDDLGDGPFVWTGALPGPGW